MKTLVLSLLRLGDFFQQLPLLEQLREEGRDVHVLVNDSVRAGTELFPEYTFHFFPRESLQGILTDSHRSTLQAVSELDTFMTRLNAEGFDSVENWTHNFLSARLMDLIDARKKKGARFTEGYLQRESRGAYLNETWGPTKYASFHWIEALSLTMNRPFPAIPRADRHRQGPVLLQALTSDSKKNWRLEAWKGLASGLIADGEEVRVPCAPFEREILLNAGFDPSILRVCDLRELSGLLESAKLLVSGDTSVLHLATWKRTPVLGIFLGSADPRKTAPRALGSKVIWADSGCSPCLHRDPCQKDRHVCGEKISLEFIQQEVNQMIRNDPQAFQSASVKVLEGAQSPSGAFLMKESGFDPLALWSQVVWEFYLNRDHDSRVAPFGSAARLILQNAGSGKGMRALIATLRDRLEVSFSILEDFSEALWTAMRDFNVEQSVSAASEVRMRELSLQLASLWTETDFISRLTESNLSSDANPFVRIRNRKEALQETHQLLLVQKNLIRVIEQEFKERGVHHGARA